jgi:hypothetical protein
VLGLPEDLLKKGKHFILIRNPLDILVTLISIYESEKEKCHFSYFWDFITK